MADRSIQIKQKLLATQSMLDVSKTKLPGQAFNALGNVFHSYKMFGNDSDLTKQPEYTDTPP